MGLIVSRRIGERIVFDIGDRDIVVEVTDIRRNKVRLVCQAPPEVAIYRAETLEDYDAPNKAKQSAVGAGVPSEPSHPSNHGRDGQR